MDNKIDMIRAAMPAVTKQVYLNTGTAGPFAQVTLEALHEAAQYANEVGRGNFVAYAPFFESADSLRQQFATLTRSPVEAIALTHHTTDGMNIAIHGLNWQPGDQLLTTNWEHQGGYIPSYIVARRRQADICVVDLEYDDDSADITRRLAAAITPRTRLIVLSHIAWNTGLRLDLKAICAMAHERGVLVLADAAQSIGSIPLDLPASGVDFYAMPAQKWLCGPEGIGALYVRRDRLPQLELTYGGFLSLKTPADYDLTGHYMPAPTARRYEVGTVNKLMYKGMVANLNWLAEEVGWPYIYNRIEALTAYAYAKLAALDGVRLYTQKSAGSGLITFALDDYDPPRVMVKLNESNIVLRYLTLPSALRVSVGFYNTEQDIDTLIDHLRQIQQLNPDDLPVYVSPFD